MPLNFDIREFDEVTSTNDLVKQAIAEGVPEGLVVCAKRQTAGYGRRGNRWQSGEGSLYMSLLLRPDVSGCSVQTLSLVVAVAVRRAVAALLPGNVGECVKVKWPNDVVVGDATVDAFDKLSGISVELKSGAVCVGIGVNVRPPVIPDAAPCPHPSFRGEASCLHLSFRGARSGNLSSFRGEAEKSCDAPQGIAHMNECAGAHKVSRVASLARDDEGGEPLARDDEGGEPLARDDEGGEPAGLYDEAGRPKGEGGNGGSPGGRDGVACEEPARNRPTYMSELAGAEACPSVPNVRDAVLKELADAYETWFATGFAGLHDEYMRHFALTGAVARIEEASCAGGTEFPGGAIGRCTVEGVDEEGRLLVSADGAPGLTEVVSGSVIIAFSE